MRRLPLALIFMLASAAALFVGFKVLRSVAAGFALYYLACCVALPLLELVAVRKVPLSAIPGRLGLARPTRADWAIGSGVGAAMVTAMIVALYLLRDSVFGDGTILAALRSWGATGERMAMVYLVMLAFNGAVEELFWRGYLHELLAPLPRRLAAGALTTLFFGAQHAFVISSIVQSKAIIGLFLFGITGAGAVWAFIRERTGRLLPCVISHMMVTAAYLGAFYLLSS